MVEDIPFQRHFDFVYETVEQLSPMIRRIVARNPNFFTFHGTNTFILGHGVVALVDPGPDTDEHIGAIINGLGDETISHILITHSHIDHWPAYQAIQEKYGIPTFGFHHEKSRLANGTASEIRALSNQERFEFTGFEPDVGLSHGDVIEGKNWSVECVFTPGHASNHMCYQLREEATLLSGDHVMAWSTSVISPPSGVMEDYMNSLELLLSREDKLFYPAHGSAVENPQSFVRSFIDHRKMRENQILEQVQNGNQTIGEMVKSIYKDVPKFLHPAAERSVLAAIILMKKKGLITCQGEPSVHSKYFFPQYPTEFTPD